MPRTSRTAARWLALAPFLAVVCLSIPLAAQRPFTAVTVGETSAGPVPEVLPVFRDALADGLAELDGIRVARGGDAAWVVRGSVTRLERVPAEGGARVECEVSLVVAERRGGAVRMISNGRARTVGERAEELTDVVVRAAVHSALSRLAPELARAR